VAAEFFEGFIVVAIVHDGAVIRAEDDEGVFGELEAVESFHDFSDGPIELDDGVCTEAVGGDALEALMGDAGDVEVVGGIEEEEGVVFVLLDELIRFFDPFVGEVFIAEACFLASGVEADAGDAVVDGAVMTVGPVLLEGVAVASPGGVIG